MFSLDKLDQLQSNQERGIQVPVYVPGTKELLFSVKVCGPDSVQQRRAQEMQSEERVARGLQFPMTSDEQLASTCRLLARCCMDWDLKDDKGEAVPFTEDLAFDVIHKYGYVRELVDGAAGSRARFTARSQTASAEQ